MESLVVLIIFILLLVVLFMNKSFFTKKLEEMSERAEHSKRKETASMIRSFHMCPDCHSRIDVVKKTEEEAIVECRACRIQYKLHREDGDIIATKI